MWKAEQMIELMYKGSPKSNINFKEITTKGKKIGEGDFGVTYLYQGKAIKFVEVQNPTHLKNELRSVKLNKEAQSLKYEMNGKMVPCVCPVLEGGTSADIIKENNKQYLWFTMPALSPFEHSLPNLKSIFAACRVLVKNGFLHNDFHMGNVMSYNKNPIIIDLGLMQKTTMNPSLVDVLTFAQIATFLDNCNSNTRCMNFTYEPAFLPYRKATEKYFEKHTPSKNSAPLAVSKSILVKSQKQNPKLPIMVQLQLVVAKLSLDYFSKGTCGFTNPSWCKKPASKSVGDIVYAIRDPTSNGMTHKDVYDFIVNAS